MRQRITQTVNSIRVRVVDIQDRIAGVVERFRMHLITVRPRRLAHSQPPRLPGFLRVQQPRLPAHQVQRLFALEISLLRQAQVRSALADPCLRP